MAVSLLCFLLGFLAVTSSVNLGANTDERDERITKGNELMDRIMKDVHDKHGDEYDPYPTKILELKVKEKVLFLTLEALLRLNGSMEGLKTLKRQLDSTLKEEGDTLRLSSVLSVKNLKFTYEGFVKFQGLQHSITASCITNYAEIALDLSFNKEDGRNGKLEGFRIKEVRDPKCTFQGLGTILKWLLETVTNALKIAAREAVRLAMQLKLHPRLQEEVPGYQFPVGPEYETTTAKEPTETTTTEKPTETTATEKPTETTTTEEPTETTTTEEPTETTTTEKPTETTTTEKPTETTTTEEPTETTTTEKPTETTTTEESTEATPMEELPVIADE